ncbi:MULTISPECIES: YhcH/YjgK/YiaL family protein [Anaerococcus]|jgi:YhcH/YjgK/YiaL family protein|uniref:YhcH/YjgK/YiaL family protein n=1 Tax=Anaerococcus TaxID=165779 RepID=UPI0023556ED7|nr:MULTISPECIES: YhcH/YjgK/YiaL family protein [Anaerococcus]MDU2599369.1 YhcH/YjgK/YiaL family protein [Anaerococcus sp.]MDU5230249.1 YhcH/YjgK/YiaL family protein [Anaerococcus sp.]MDU5534720.1 YhcH/YjgK/YiaL family protein [Anaerococcus sp.]
MIFGSTTNLEEYAFLEDKIKACFDFYKENDMENMETGIHKIDGDDLFVNIVEYDTTTPENRFWEAHKEYLDLHLMLLGEEKINLNFLKEMEVLDYDPEADFQAANGEKNSSVDLKVGDFLICYPNDVHMTALQIDDPVYTKKAIFKIKI